jgi:putative aldouronate transport system permease protein
MLIKMKPAVIKTRGKKGKWGNYGILYLMALPGLLYLVCNNYLPMFGLVIAFKNLNFRLGILKSPWAGLSNFKYLFASKDALIITRNTVLYNLTFIVIGTIFAIFVAILLSELRAKFLSRLYQSIILVPQLMSWVVVGYLVFAMLSADVGLFNKGILEKLGREGISWYNTPEYWPVILVIVNQWKGIGFQAVIYLAGIVGISQDYYEAARIDGAGKIAQIWHITLPLLKPTVITLTILSLGRMFYSDFGLFYQIPRNSGALYGATRTIDVYVYNALMNSSNFSMSSAASFYQSIVGFILIISANALIRKISRENAIF